MSADRNNGDRTVRMPTLSVTYGTFSLTLEGFEDPFATMRDVADYFRTVLAEDRAFGSRAAAPRTEALRQVAEGRLGSSVEARASEGRVHLRAKPPQPTRPRTFPLSEALFDEEAEAPAGPASPPTAAPPQAPAPAPSGDRTERSDDLFDAAFDAPRNDALEGDETSTLDLLAAPAGPARRAGLPAGADEEAVERLISQADSALAGPEAQRRHATFAQLKAAVAATRAEADAGVARRPGRTAAEIARYRDDLAQSVGDPSDAPAPRRSGRGAPPTPPPVPSSATPLSDPAARPRDAATRATPPVKTAGPRAASSGAGAPLVLATAHRVNGKGEGKAPPRGTSPAIPTISALFDEGEETPAPPADRFSRFLDEAAPADLAAAIDAAAAYLTHVEGLEDFPRQQLMRLIAPVEGAQDREAVMRSFGILLRDERLRRSRRGQFESGARSGFVEVARRFGQSA